MMQSLKKKPELFLMIITVMAHLYHVLIIILLSFSLIFVPGEPSILSPYGEFVDCTNLPNVEVITALKFLMFSLCSPKDYVCN